MRVPFHGWLEIEEPGGVPLKPVLGLGALIAIASWLATVLWQLAVIAVLALAAAAAAAVYLRHGSARDRELLAERFAAIPPPRARPQVTAGAREIHYHIHLAPGADVPGIISALPERDAITTGEAREALPQREE